MTSFDCRLKAIKACSACGNLHTSAFCCSKEKLKNKILVPMPESSQQHIKIERICFDCGNLLHGLNCLECDLTRKIVEKTFQKFQNTSKSSNDNSNVVNAPREPFVVKQDPSVNSSQKSPLIDQKCCCECGDSLDGIFCQQCTCKSCGKGAHVGYNCPPKTPIISNPEPTKQTVDKIPQARKSGVDNRRITLIVIHARANSAVVVSLMEFVLVVLMEMEIKSIFQLRTLLINLQVSLTTPHTLSKSCVNFAGNNTKYWSLLYTSKTFYLSSDNLQPDLNSPQRFA
ncbi:hypothetical protein Tco_0168642 [Tanacetum coccineum]